MKLIIATPSPFARKARIALIEKSVPHEVTIDVPWNADSQTRARNPLGKVPVLILDDGQAFYDSRVIVRYLDAAHPVPPLLPPSPMERVAHARIEALADGICDAVVLITIEGHRKPDLQSPDWIARQRAKAESGTAELAQTLSAGDWFINNAFGLADIATACALAYLDLRLPDFDWRTPHPQLAVFAEKMEQRPSFMATQPVAQEIAEIG